MPVLSWSGTPGSEGSGPEQASAAIQNSIGDHS